MFKYNTFNMFSFEWVKTCYLYIYEQKKHNLIFTNTYSCMYEQFTESDINYFTVFDHGAKTTSPYACKYNLQPGNSQLT